MSSFRELGCHQRNIHGHGIPRLNNPALILCYAASYTPMLIALGLIGAVTIPYCYYFLYDYCYLSLYYSGYPYPFLYSSLLSVFCFGGLLVAYFRSVFTSPGFAEKDGIWAECPRVLHVDGVVRDGRHGSRNTNIVVATFEGFQPRWCSKCQVFKPDRSHHCSECGKCVLKLDHHCPWICSCVGERNHKYFLLFLLYIGFSGIHIVTSVLASHTLYNSIVPLSAGQNISHFLISLVAGVFALVLGLFGVFHIFLIGSEESTIERNIARLTGKVSAQQKVSWVKRCVDLWCTLKSLREMLEPVMGDASPMWQWILPCFSPRYTPLNACVTMTDQSSNSNNNSSSVTVVSATNGVTTVSHPHFNCNAPRNSTDLIMNRVLKKDLESNTSSLNQENNNNNNGGTTVV